MGANAPPRDPTADDATGADGPSADAPAGPDPTPENEGANGQSTATADGYDAPKLAVATFGDPGGHPVLFCHGTPGSRRLGELFDDAASDQGVHLLAVDRPGYGDSPAQSGERQVDVADAIDAVLRDRGVTRLGIVAFSGGSRDAFAVAARSSATVECIDVVAGSVPPRFQTDQPTVQRLLGALARRTPRALGALVRGQAWIAGHASPSFVTTQYTSEDAETDIPDEAAELVKRDFREAIAGDASGFVHETRRLATSWSVPDEVDGGVVRFWHGECDTNVPIDGARRFADSIDGTTLTALEGADHLGTLLAVRERVMARQRNVL